VNPITKKTKIFYNGKFVEEQDSEKEDFQMEIPEENKEEENF